MKKQLQRLWVVLAMVLVQAGTVWAAPHDAAGLSSEGRQTIAASDNVALTRVSRVAQEWARSAAQALPVENKQAVYAFFPDVAYTVTVTRVTTVYGGAQSIEGRPVDGANIRFSSLRAPDGIRYEIHDFNRGKLYQAISCADGSLEVREYDDAKRPPKWGAPPMLGSVGLKAPPAPARAVRVARAAAFANTSAVIDLMLVFDTTAKTWADNNGGVTAFANAAVAKMNVALVNSGVVGTFRLVHILLADYTSRGFLYTDLSALTSGRGKFASLSTLRNTHGADIVSMVVDTGSAYGTTGLGYYPFSAAGDESAAFSVCAIRSVNISHTLTHEVGHNLGCGHSKYQSDDPGPSSTFAYAAGWYFRGDNLGNYNTIMAYGFDGYGGHYDEVDYFSTPLVTYQGVAVGHPSDGDNVRTLNSMFPVVAAYRERALEPVAIPRFSPLDNTVFTNVLTVTLVCDTPDAAIRFTTDGTVPTAASPLYQVPITLAQTTTINAKGFKFGMADSTMASASYTWVALDESFLCDPSGGAALTSAGAYDGFFYAENDFEGVPVTAVVGTLALKVSTLDGKLTAKAALQGGTIRFSAKAWTSAEIDGTFHLTMPARGGETLDLFVRQNRIWGTLTGGNAGVTPLTLDGARNRFADRDDAAATALLEQFHGYYTMALPTFDGVSAFATVDAAPRGVGYLAVTVRNKGSVKIAGVLADGTRVSRSSQLIRFDDCGDMACVPLFAPLYSKKGWMGGLLWLDPAAGTFTTDRDVSWFIRWENPGKKGPEGFSMLLNACGGFYSTVPALAAEYLFTAAADAPYWHAEGVEEAVALPTVLPVVVEGTRLTLPRGLRPTRVRGEDGATWYEYDEVNPTQATLSLAARTGIFKGKFVLYYDYEVGARAQHKSVRTSYAGILTPLRDTAFADLPTGMGYSLVPDKDPATRTYRLKRSYPVWLETE